MGDLAPGVMAVAARMSLVVVRDRVTIFVLPRSLVDSPLSHILLHICIRYNIYYMNQCYNFNQDWIITTVSRKRAIFQPQLSTEHHSEGDALHQEQRQA